MVMFEQAEGWLVSKGLGQALFSVFLWMENHRICIGKMGV